MIYYARKIIWLIFLSAFVAGCSGLKFGSSSNLLVERAAVKTPKQITLLLPFGGNFASSSQAIHNGFLAAYYYARQKHPDINIKVVDTSRGDVGEFYKQAVALGADVIVGPLTKDEVEAVIASGPLTVPTIALNTADNYVDNVVPNLYQFGLVPQDDAIQAAAKILGDRHQRVAIIAPDNAWGERIIKVFAKRYTASGGTIVASLGYEVGDSNLASQICNFVAADPNKLCVRQKHRSKQDKIIPDVLNRRQDIDAIFLVANQNDARQIIPLLKFYYAGDLPLYATADIFNGSSRMDVNRDLGGAMFCDMPWVLADQSLLPADLQAIHAQIVAAWPESFSNYSKLYALGVDAFNLAINLGGFLQAPQAGMKAATGTLYLDSYNHIYRELEWAKIQVDGTIDVR